MSSPLQVAPGYGQELLVCPPTCFDIRYAINPWMKDSSEQGIRVDKTLAFRQWMRLTRLLAMLGARLRYIMPDEDSPDMVFTANAGFLYRKRFAVSRFRHRERKNEEKIFFTYFKAMKGIAVTLLPRHVSFEGRGDALSHGGTLLCGYGMRSSPEGMAAMTNAVGYTGARVFLELVDERFYHLDTCLCSLGKDILWYPPAFRHTSQIMIQNLSNIGRSVVVAEEDAMRFACNGIYLENRGRRALITSPLSSRLRSALEDLNIAVYENDVSEFLKAGGGNQCLVFPLT